MSGAANRVPGVPRDLEDDERDHEPDDRVGDVESQCDESRTCDHPEGHEAVDTRMTAVGEQGGTVEPSPGPQPNLCRNLVPDKADRTRSRQQPQVRKRARIQETLDRLPERDESAGKDREHHAESSPAFALLAPQE